MKAVFFPVNVPLSLFSTDRKQPPNSPSEKSVATAVTC